MENGVIQSFQLCDDPNKNEPENLSDALNRMKNARFDFAQFGFVNSKELKIIWPHLKERFPLKTSTINFSITGLTDLSSTNFNDVADIFVVAVRKMFDTKPRFVYVKLTPTELELSTLDEVYGEPSSRFTVWFSDDYNISNIPAKLFPLLFGMKLNGIRKLFLFFELDDSVVQTVFDNMKWNIDQDTRLDARQFETSKIAKRSESSWNCFCCSRNEKEYSHSIIVDESRYLNWYNILKIKSINTKVVYFYEMRNNLPAELLRFGF